MKDVCSTRKAGNKEGKGKEENERELSKNGQMKRGMGVMN